MPFYYDKHMTGRDVKKMSRETGLRQSLVLATVLEDRSALRRRSLMIDHLVKS